MNKKIVLLLSVILLIVLSSCSTTVQVDLDTIMADINSTYQFDDMVVLSDVNELEQYFSIDTSVVQSFSAQISSTTSDITELVFVQAVDNDSASEIATTLYNHYQSRLSEAKSYSPESLKLLESCSVEQNGTYVSLVISENAEGIIFIYNSYFE